ncbi:hypothetical protein [Pseudoalteromonas sp. PPB1]|uniref:hypothetical protein n=1 Tax=Pseudoalteromonas sp. PPB1 TaxID=2756136 RepID=UPI001891C24D|nr:hypothetical protein [Pseudoalteromonas sp. PPB1]
MKYYEACEKLRNEHPKLIEQLAATDNLEKWGEISKIFTKEDKKKIYDMAEPKWIERKIEEGTLLLNPEVKKELETRDYKPLSILRKMIWASVLVMLEGEDSKENFSRIKRKIIKKHTNKWWFDVYNRLKPTYAAKAWLDKEGLGLAVSYAVQNSSFLGGVAQSKRDDILRMIPSGEVSDSKRIKRKGQKKVSPSSCPACSSFFVTGTFKGWICADCGATDKSPVSREKG